MPEATIDTRKTQKPGPWTASAAMPLEEPVYVAPAPGRENDPLARAESERRFAEAKRKAELEREEQRERERQQREEEEKLKREAEAAANGTKQVPGPGAPTEEVPDDDSGGAEPMLAPQGAEGNEKKQEQRTIGAGEPGKSQEVDPAEKKRKEEEAKAREQKLADDLQKQEAKEWDIQEKRGRNRAMIREEIRNPLDESKLATPEYANFQRIRSIAKYLVVFEGMKLREVDEHYEIARAKYAKKELGNENASNRQVFEHIQSVLNLNDAIADMAFNAATDDLLPPTEAFLKVRTELMKRPGYRSERESEYLAQFSAVQREAKRQMAPLRDEARNVIGILQGARTDGEVAAALPYILGKSGSEMGLLWHLMRHEAALKQREMGFGEQSSMAVERSFQNIARKVLRTVETIRNNTAIAHLREGMSVPAHLKTAEEIVQWKSLELLEAREASLDGGAGGLGYMLLRSLETKEYRTLSKEQYEEIQALPTKLAKTQHEIAKFVNFQQDTLEPIVGSNWFTRNLYYPVLGSSGELALAAVPYGAGLPFLAMSTADDHAYKLIEEGVQPEAAFRDALWVGAATAAMERFNPAALTRKLPLTKGVMERFLARPGGNMMRFGVQLGTMTAEQTAVAQFQAHIIPALISDISKVQGDVKWLEKDGPIDMAIRTAPETAGGVLLLSSVASGFMSVHDAGLSGDLMQSPVTLMQAGFSPRQAMEIREAALRSPSQGVAAMRVRWNDRAGTVSTMQEAGLQARQEAHLQKAVVQELEDSGVLPPILQEGARTTGGAPGFALRLREDAEPLRFKSRAEAEAVRWEWAQDKHPKLGEKVAEITSRLKEGRGGAGPGANGSGNTGTVANADAGAGWMGGDIPYYLERPKDGGEVTRGGNVPGEVEGLAVLDRFQSAKLKEVWSKLKPIANGPALHFGRSDAPSALMKAVEESLAKQPDKVQTPDGRTVLIKHNREGGTIQGLYEHLATHEGGRPDKIRAGYASRISHTLQHAAVRLTDPQTGRHVYIARYADHGGHKNAHFVVVSPDGMILDQGPVDLLKTTWVKKAEGNSHLGKYGDMEALQFSRSRENAHLMPAADRTGATDARENISGQSPHVSGSTVWVNPNSGLTQRQGEEFVASLLGQRSSAVRADAAEVRAALERVRAEEPELLDDEMVIIAANPRELAAAGRGYEKLSEAQLEHLGLSEGVHDTETGKSIIFTDQIELRPGETPRQAVTRVIEHERIGHEGVNFMMRTDAEFKTKWEALSKQIPSTQLTGLLENGYHDLAGNPSALALEWLAQQVDKYKADKTPVEMEQAMPGVARQLWQAVKDWIVKRRSRGGDVSKLNFDNEVRELLGRAHEAVTSGKTREDAKARAAEAPSRTRPDFIKLADSNNTNNISHGQETPEIRDPRRALEARRGGAGGRSARSSEEAARVRGHERSGQSDTEGYRLPRIDEESFGTGLRELERYKGEEHDVFRDPKSRRAVKMTKPGKTGVKGSLEGYLQRLAWSNELFGDDITVEGFVQLPGEAGERVVTTQPWRTPDKETPHPEQAEIDQYMRNRGFLRAYDGAYIHESRDIVATDAVPKNFVEDRHGIVHPIDVILAEPNSEQHERLTNMARNQTQLEKTNDAPPLPKMQFTVSAKVIGIWVRRQPQISAPPTKYVPGGERVRREEAQKIWDALPESVTTKDGRQIFIKNAAQGTLETTLEHLITSHSAERQWVDVQRIASLNRIPLTLANAGMRIYGDNGKHIYIQPYDDGKNHYVIVSPNQVVLAEGYGDVLTSQWIRKGNDDDYLEGEYVEPLKSP